jgi:hypothetical protein
MPSSQTRISVATHERLVRLASETGKTHQEVLDIVLRAYERALFLENLNQDFARLRADEEAWKEEMVGRSAWDMTLTDGATD